MPVLLLLRDLDDETAARLQARARDLGMDVLVEAHDSEELARAVALGADPIGINARDLETFSIDRRAQLELVAAAPRDRTIVAESGVEARVHARARRSSPAPTRSSSAPRSCAPPIPVRRSRRSFRDRW